MKLWILLALCSSILLFGCLQNNPTQVNQTTQINQTTYNNPTTPQIAQAAANIYVKDAPVAATNVQVEIKKVTLINDIGESKVIFEGSQTISLDEKTTTRVASSKIDAKYYSQLYIELGNQAIVKDANGTHTATVANTQIRSSLNSQVENNQTMQVVMDVPIKETIQVTNDGNYTFTPNAQTTATTTIAAGIQISSIGVISVDLENTLGVIHTPLNSSIDANLNVSAILG